MYTPKGKTKQMEDTNMKASTGMKVQGYKSSCIGILIQASCWNGEIIKVNKKSIRVHLTENINTCGGKETSRWNISRDVTYTFWKTTEDGREIYRSEGKVYGIITL
jgi:hypothetical protein